MAFCSKRLYAASLLKTCDHIRGWIDLCLRIYAEIGMVNPRFLESFDD